MLDGGAGRDTLSFEGAGSDIGPGGVTASLAAQGGPQATGQGTMTFTGFENLSGSVFGDTLTGDAGANSLMGYGGSDSLVGGDGDDTLLGDSVAYVDSHGVGTSGPIVVFADQDAGNDTLVGGAGNDLLKGEAGDDVLNGGTGADVIDGGAGVDTATYADASGPVLANLLTGGATGAAGEDHLAGIENLTGSAFDDQLQGGDGANVLAGGDGADALRGAGGADTLAGGQGDDFLVGGEGDDRLDGGAGVDRVAYGAAAHGVTVDLTLQGVAQDTGQGQDILVGVEQASGSIYGDVITGDGSANWLWGVAGPDTLSGGGGDDLLSVGAGDSRVDGGAGVDGLSFYSDSLTGPVRVSLALQGAPQDTGQGRLTIAGVENLSGTMVGGDTLTGDAGSNVLAGWGGDDALDGGDGDDTLLGDGVIHIDAHGAAGAGPIATFPADLAGADTLDGGKGDDTLIGGAGADVLSGGGGADHFVFLSLDDSEAGARDLITDLDKKDVIDLSGIDANVIVGGDQAFAIVAAFTGHAGELALDYDKATKTSHVSLDVDGDGQADMVIDVAGKLNSFDGFIL
jgi:Ca2+-binding RTX toxin-like protein